MNLWENNSMNIAMTYITKTKLKKPIKTAKNLST